MYVLPVVCWSLGFVITRKLLSTSKIAYIGLWLRLEIDLVHPTEENEKTDTFVAPKSVKMAEIGFFENKPIYYALNILKDTYKCLTV